MPATATPLAEHPAAAFHARRRREKDEKMLAATRAILARDGIEALTIERVAAESGLAKTTIYRRAKNARHLAATAIAGPVVDDTDASVLARVVGSEMVQVARTWHRSAIECGQIAPEITLDTFVRVALAAALED